MENVPMTISLSWGDLPTRKQFNAQFRSIVGYGDDFQMHLKGSDARCASRHAGSTYRDGNNYYDDDDLWDIVKSLAVAGEDGADCAGDLVSSIFATLDIEWI